MFRVFCEMLMVVVFATILCPGATHGQKKFESLKFEKRIISEKPVNRAGQCSKIKMSAEEMESIVDSLLQSKSLERPISDMDRLRDCMDVIVRGTKKLEPSKTASQVPRLGKHVYESSKMPLGKPSEHERLVAETSALKQALVEYEATKGKANARQSLENLKRELRQFRKEFQVLEIELRTPETFYEPAGKWAYTVTTEKLTVTGATDISQTPPVDITTEKLTVTGATDISQTPPVDITTEKLIVTGVTNP